METFLSPSVPCLIFVGKTSRQMKDAEKEIKKSSTGYGVCSTTRWKATIDEAVTGKAWATKHRH
jgi:hypothetical protein